MSLAIEPAVAARPEHDASQHDAPRYLFHPVVDFLCLGGLSLLVLPWMWLQGEAARPAMAVAALFLADVLNHPHFAHSYQIFYRGFGDKLGGREISSQLRIRYLIAGVVVPVLLAGFLATAISQHNLAWLGYAGNAMLFLVGWHYTKQGYGMLMVDAAFKRRFFKDREKQILMVNAYVTWLSYWVAANYAVHEYELWGLKYYAIGFPTWLVWVGGAAMGVTTLASLVVFGRVRLLGRQLPWTGVVVYLLTLYIWTVGRLDPILLVLIPAFHSLQYLIVVWRFELNRARASPAVTSGRASALTRLAVFVGAGVLLGLAGFWWIPQFLEDNVQLNFADFEGAVFLFAFWIFINVHHYFIDNVIWRRDNPETKAFLFG